MIFLLNSLESFLWVTLFLDNSRLFVFSFLRYFLSFFLSSCHFLFHSHSYSQLLFAVAIGASHCRAMVVVNAVLVSGHNEYRCSHYCHPICLGLAVDFSRWLEVKHLFRCQCKKDTNRFNSNDFDFYHLLLHHCHWKCATIFNEF